MTTERRYYNNSFNELILSQLSHEEQVECVSNWIVAWVLTTWEWEIANSIKDCRFTIQSCFTSIDIQITDANPLIVFWLKNKIIFWQEWTIPIEFNKNINPQDILNMWVTAGPDITRQLYKMWWRDLQTNAIVKSGIVWQRAATSYVHDYLWPQESINASLLWQVIWCNLIISNKPWISYN